MAAVTLEKVNKLYENGFHAVHDLDLDIADGEFLVLVGPSGCGKTTALRMVAGLEDISTGRLKIGEKVVNTLSPKDRDIAMVFQSYALYPHMTLRENISYGLRIRRMPKDEIESRVQRAARMLDLTHMLDRKPKQLSGGQRQRVAMGRAIVREPAVFLMDEPLSNLDAKLRVQMRADIAQIQRDLGTTTIYVTHDQVEAMTMGTRVAVMKLGILQQVDAPQTLYDDPDNLFVAGFIGSPPMNMGLVPVSAGNDGSIAIRLADHDLVISPERVAQRPGLRRYINKRLIIGLRSEDIRDAREVPGLAADQSVPANVLLTEALGSQVMVRFGIDVEKPSTEDVKELEKDAHTDEEGDITPDSQSQWVAAFGPRTKVRPGDRIDVALDTAQMHFFDPDTSAAVRD